MFISPTELHNGYKISSSQKKISQKGFDSIKTNTIKGPSVLVGCIGWDMGNVGYTEQKCATNQQINAITDFAAFCEPLYIYYWLRNKKDYLFSIASVTRTPILSKSNFAEIPISLPNIAYQKNTVKLLSSIDDKIALNRRINAKLEAMAKRLYDYWFVQFDFPNADGKPYKSSGGKMEYKETLKREIPAGWDVKCIFDCADVLYGFPFATEPFDEDIRNSKKPFSVIRIRDILDNTISAKTDENPGVKYKTQVNDLLIGMDGYFHMNFCYRNDDYVNQRIVRIRETEISSLLIYHQIKPFIKFKEQQAKGSTVGHLSDKDMKSINILVPDDKSISNRFDTVLSKITKNVFEIQKLTTMRDRLLPLLMNGQVEVK